MVAIKECVNEKQSAHLVFNLANALVNQVEEIILVSTLAHIGYTLEVHGIRVAGNRQALV